MLGPVFAWEFVRAGRRRWHWWLRVLYVSLLLLFLYATFGSVTRFADRQNHQILAEIGAQFYRAFSFYQLLTVLVLSPVFAVTSVADEKTRHTLPFLLASRLRASEIVLAKIGLAVLRVWEVLLCGLPLCATCLLLGGVTPEFMAVDFLVAMAAAWASCALGVLAAILTRRLSEGLLLVLLIQLLWYTLPAIDWMLRRATGFVYFPGLVSDMNVFLAVYRGQTAGMVTDPWHGYAVALGATLFCGLMWSCLACAILRPAWRREQEHLRPRWLFLSGRQPRPARLVWDLPWLWRELRSRPPSAIDRVMWALCVTMAVGVLATIASYWQTSLVALKSSPTAAATPVSLIVIVYAQFFYLSLMALPYLTIAGACALAAERDAGHLDLMCITLLDQRNLVHAKAARLAVCGACVVLFPIVLQVLLYALGWSTVWATSLAIFHCLAATTFWLTFGMAMSFRFEKSSHALIASLAALLGAMIVGPALTGLFDDDVNALVFSSTPVHCMVLAIMDNLVQPKFHRELSVVTVRHYSLTFSVLHLLAALAMYYRALHPTPPWLDRADWNTASAANLARDSSALTTSGPGLS